MVAARALRRPRGADLDPHYRIYTRDYDRIVHAKELDTVLGDLSEAETTSMAEAWETFEVAMFSWQVRHSLAALEASGRIRAVLGDTALKGAEVTLLVDQSGSMRGERILLATAAVNVAQDFLANLGASVEILGFTTVNWWGGAARKRWIAAGRPPNPGRVCELLHIIYRDRAMPGSGTGGWHLRPMLRPGLLKENVDGEALLWAAQRLRRGPAKRKLLVVISDGAPVDDATLEANGPKILDEHLREVVGELEASRDIELAAIGIAHDASRYYSTSVVVATPDELGSGLLGLLERVIVREAGGDGRSPPGPANP